MKKHCLKKGILLIAEPSIINDSDFNRSVILLTNHDSYGSVGFIMNKPLDIVVSDILPDLKANFTVFNGGPVEQNNLYFIHNVPQLVPKSIEISNGIFWGGDFAAIKTLINTKQINKNNIRFFLGYSGWDAGQLVAEINNCSWIILKNIDNDKIIEKNASQLWKIKILELGEKYIVWSNAPENPLLN